MEKVSQMDFILWLEFHQKQILIRTGNVTAFNIVEIEFHIPPSLFLLLLFFFCHTVNSAFGNGICIIKSALQNCMIGDSSSTGVAFSISKFTPEWNKNYLKQLMASNYVLRFQIINKNKARK